MQVVHGHTHVPVNARGAVVAIGNFDGVHRGHRALIAEAVRKAKELERASGVMIFEPHPREFFHPAEPLFRLTPLKRKLSLLEKLGLKLAFVETFDQHFASLSARDFIERVLVAGLGIAHVIVGYDFYFGHKRSGNPQMLAEAGKELGFGVTIMSPVAEAGEVFSSSAARVYLAQGDVRGATQVLGEAWRVGRVHLPLNIEWNGAWFGHPNGSEMNFSFYELIAHAAKTRRLRAGTIIGSGTVSNADRNAGSACISERRVIELLDTGASQTGFMYFGDTVRMEVLHPEGYSIFGAIEQRVTQI